MKRILSIAMFGLLAASCGTTRKAGSDDGYSVSRSQDPGPDKKKADADPQEDRVVLYNAWLRLSVKVPDSANVRLSEIASQYGGYALTLGNRTSVIRVKAANLHAAVNSIATLGKLKHKTISGEDVTDDYTDFSIRLDNAIKARKRYLELLEKAENVEATLKVEKELERLNGEIDVLQGRLRRMKHLSEYSTINIDLQEKAKPGIVGYVGIGLYKAVKWLFVRN